MRSENPRRRRRRRRLLAACCHPLPAAACAGTWAATGGPPPARPPQVTRPCCGRRCLTSPGRRPPPPPPPLPRGAACVQATAPRAGLTLLRCCSRSCPTRSLCSPPRLRCASAAAAWVQACCPPVCLLPARLRWVRRVGVWALRGSWQALDATAHPPTNPPCPAAAHHAQRRHAHDRLVRCAVPCCALVCCDVQAHGCSPWLAVWQLHTTLLCSPAAEPALHAPWPGLQGQRALHASLCALGAPVSACC